MPIFRGKQGFSFKNKERKEKKKQNKLPKIRRV